MLKDIMKWFIQYKCFHSSKEPLLDRKSCLQYTALIERFVPVFAVHLILPVSFYFIYLLFIFLK